MAADSALFVVVYADGSRSTPISVPDNGRWFETGCRVVRERLKPGADKAWHFRGLVVIAPDGHVSSYNANEVVEVLGLEARPR